MTLSGCQITRPTRLHRLNDNGQDSLIQACSGQRVQYDREGNARRSCRPCLLYDLSGEPIYSWHQRFRHIQVVPGASSPDPPLPAKKSFSTRFLHIVKNFIGVSPSHISTRRQHRRDHFGFRRGSTRTHGEGTYISVTVARQSMIPSITVAAFHFG